jgi:hypothetical protein
MLQLYSLQCLVVVTNFVIVLQWRFLVWVILACEAPNYGDNCGQVCQCGAGVDSCDPVRGCVCLSGWTGMSCDQDIDECTTNPAICGSDKVCENLQGSYTCNCREGFRKNGTDCEGKYQAQWLKIERMRNHKC